MAVSSSGSASAAKACAERKSWSARVSQSRTSSVLDSSINLTTIGENLVKQRGAQMLVAINLGASRHKHVFGKTHSTQTMVGALHPLDVAFFAGGNNDHQIYITVIRRRAPRVRAEQINFLRLKFGFQPFHRCFQKSWRNYFHGTNFIKCNGRCEAGSRIHFF